MPNVTCPSCQGPQELSRFAMISTCEYCGMTFTLDQGAVMALGKMGIMTEYPTPWYVKATGVFRGKHFTIAGRIRYRYKRGFWDEWYFQFEDGEEVWVSEDEGELCFERHVSETDLPSWSQLSPGTPVTVNGHRMTVDERDEARMDGIEGELPRIVKVDESFQYVDASNAQRSATIEYFRDDIVVYEGEWVNETDFRLDHPKEDSEGGWFDA